MNKDLDYPDNDTGYKRMTDTRKETLTALRDRVQAGKVGQWFNWDSGIKGHGAGARLAYKGSLDAAKALHDAVLPEWEYGYDGSIAWVKLPGLRTSYRRDSMGGLTSRAWLLAILSALIAMEDGE